MMMHDATRAQAAHSSALLLIDREMLWRKLFAFDQELDGVRNDEAVSAASAVDVADAIDTSAMPMPLSMDADALREMVHHLVSRRRHGPLRVMLEQRLRYWMRADLVPVFWRFFADIPQLVRDAQRSRRRRHELTLFCAEQLTLAMQFAEDAFAQCVEIASIFDSTAPPSEPLSPSSSLPPVLLPGLRRGSSMLDELRVSFRSLIFEDITQREVFQDVMVIFFSMSFQKFHGKEKFQAFESGPIQGLLLQLEWMHIAEPALLRVLHSQTKKMLQATCSDDYTERYLPQAEEWVCSDLLPWLDELLRTGSYASSQRWKNILARHVVQQFGSWRIAQLFEMIKEFPDSTPALEDLGACLNRTGQHAELIASFRQVLSTRLLHPGANTSAILDIYVSTIKAFRILDARGVLLESLSEPIKEYLKQRKDTVRCIVTSLTDEQNGDLFDELRKNNMRVIQQDDDSDDDEDISPDMWEPDPIEADPTKTSRSRNSDDILRILVNIYGSRELFVNEYRMMLADKLLQNVEYDTDRDVQTLELLKLRFGEDHLQHCEIMVRDIDDSKRVNHNIHSSREDGHDQGRSITKTVVDATIVSHHFWPPLQDDEFALHPSMASAINDFKKSYEVLKNPRSLAWNSALGSVQLSIELQGVEKSFTVTPLQATMIQYFADQDSWGVESLATRLEISEDAVLRHATYWLNHGVLQLSSDRVTLTAALAFTDSHLEMDTPMDEMETAVSSQAQEAEDVRLLETYIVGMLSNLGALPIQRIHNTLSTFARSGAQPYDKTISGLSVVLAKLVAQGRLELVAGQYQLAK